jgi:hypothetical protein
LTAVGSSNQLLTVLPFQREFKGLRVEVIVLSDGFEDEGERYRSLAAWLRRSHPLAATKIVPA